MASAALLLTMPHSAHNVGPRFEVAAGYPPEITISQSGISGSQEVQRVERRMDATGQVASSELWCSHR